MDNKIIPFSAPEPEEMDEQQLRDYLADLQRQIAALDQKEPRNMESEAYEAWADQHEELEDMLDEALDLLEQM